jgi:hypothetical protein
MAMGRDARYPSISIDKNMIIIGTEDQFKTLVSTIFRDLESDRDDPANKFFMKQFAEIIK